MLKVRTAGECAFRERPNSPGAHFRYDPDHPERVVVNRQCGWTMGAMIAGIGIAGLIWLIGRPAIGLFRTALRHDRFEQTTGRVKGGEVREVLEENGRPQFCASLWVDYEFGNSIRRTWVDGNKRNDRAEAEADLQAGLAATPIGRELTLWFDPMERRPISFERLTFSDAASRSLRLFYEPLVWLVIGPFFLASHLRKTLTGRGAMRAHAIQPPGH